MQEESGFNPHPTFRPDATSRRLLNHARFSLFQSSSDLQAGCNHAGHNTKRREHMFQSSSDLQAGCNGASQVLVGSRSQFQSSSDLQAGCNWWLTSAVEPSSKQFQSSSDLQAGCNYPGGLVPPELPGFQSSSDLQAGCNPAGDPGGRPDRRPVSILIRPSGRMQPNSTGVSTARGQFQSSSDLQAGCNPD